jgi:2-pyrone-4,6-dicarboxylate lactonase
MNITPDEQGSHAGLDRVAGPREALPDAWTVLDGICDCHTHVVGEPQRYPYVPHRAFTPPPADLKDWWEAQAPLRVSRGVLVQVSVHGTDNSAMTDALKQDDRLRGVAVIDASVAESDIQDLRASNVCAIRLNDVIPGGVGTTHLESVVERISGTGWHVELLLRPEDIANTARRLDRLHTRYVFDHMGFIPFSAGTGDGPFRDLLAVLRQSDAWVKLSGFRRLSSLPDHSDGALMARALYEAAPARTVWGTDWPHVGGGAQNADQTDLALTLCKWFPDPADLRRILVDNPVRLYRPTEAASAAEQEGRTDGRWHA